MYGSTGWLPIFGPNQSASTKDPPKLANCVILHLQLLFQLESWHSFHHSTEGRTLSQPGWLVACGDVLLAHPSTNRAQHGITNYVDQLNVLSMPPHLLPASVCSDEVIIMSELISLCVCVFLRRMWWRNVSTSRVQRTMNGPSAVVKLGSAAPCLALQGHCSRSAWNGLKRMFRSR